MDCRQARRQIILRLDEISAGTEAVDLQSHLIDCPSCVQHAARLDRLDTALGRGPDIDLPVALTARVMAHLPSPARAAQPRLKPPPLVALVGAASLILSAIAIARLSVDGAATSLAGVGITYGAELIVRASEMAAMTIGFARLTADILPVVGSALPIGSVAAGALLAASAIATLAYAESQRTTV